MSSNKITYQIIYEAYRKLKSYVYYDNTMLILRSQLAEFEDKHFNINDKNSFKENFKRAFKGLYEALNNEDENEFSSLINEIRYNIVPKSVVTSLSSEEGVVINNIDNDEVEVDKFNILINAPIQIHVLSVIWVMFVGKHIDCYNEEHNYAYRLYKFDEDNQGDEYKNYSLKLFKPYYEGYQKWRDNALKKASELLDNKNDATIFSIDIKRFYYSVRINLVKLIDKILDYNLIENEDDDIIKTLNNMLQKVNVCYSKKVNLLLKNVSESISEQDLKEGNVILPVGLLSSGVIANLYLRDFDISISEKLNPAYYGRYVDDMLFVFSNRKLDPRSDKVKETFINRQFVETGILKKNADDGDYRLSCFESLMVQSDKIVLEHFFHKGTRAALDKFIKNIEKNRSEFRFLPEEDVLNDEFDSQAFQLLYSGSVNKIRSIQSVSSDKFGASKYLSSKIMLAKSVNFGDKSNKLYKKTAKQILKYFSGDITISYYTLWEKVTTLFVLYKDFESLNAFINSSYKSILTIKYKGGEDDTLNHFVQYELVEHLIKTLEIAISMPLALIKESHIDEININVDLCKNVFSFIDKEKIIKFRKTIRKSSLFRHDLMVLPCLHLLDDNRDEYDYLDFDLRNEKLYLGTNQHEILYPRFIPYHEFCILSYLRNRISINDEESDIIDYYNRFNFDWLTLFHNDNRSANILKSHIEERCINCKHKKYLSLPQTKIIDKQISIGIVNMNVSDKDIESNLKGYPNRSQKRYNKLVEILNYSAKKGVDLLILPEVSVPLIWLTSLIRISLRHNMGIVCGLEHVISNNGYAYNDVATVLPFNTNDFISCSVTFRTKNYYSPSEKEMIAGYRLKIPLTEKVYEHDHWRGVYFSTYNCYELTNVEDRGIFKSEVDFLVATEWNKDTNYFSDIVGSWSRDLHCYFVQVNTSQYGDSKILSPSKQENKNILSVKGGKFDIVLVHDIDIKNLRDFQFMEHNMQKISKTGFKQTPPDFNRDNVKKRIDNKEIF